jgi:hypothetical protein
MRVRLALWLGTLAVLGFGSTCRADTNPWFSFTRCDTTSINGHQAERLSFSLHDAGAYAIYKFNLAPDYTMPADSCHAFTANAPANWAWELQSDGTVLWHTGTSGAVAPGGNLDGFQITLSRPLCCLLASFETGFIGSFDSTQLCVECPLATPVRGVSWGMLKGAYR